MVLPSGPLYGIQNIEKHESSWITTILTAKQNQLGSKHPKCCHRLAWTHGPNLSWECVFSRHANPNGAQTRSRVSKLRHSVAIWHYFFSPEPLCSGTAIVTTNRSVTKPKTRVGHELTNCGPNQAKVRNYLILLPPACYSLDFWSHDLRPVPSLVPVSVDLRRRHNQRSKSWHSSCATPVLRRDQWKSRGTIWHTHTPKAKHLIISFYAL